MFLSFHLIVLKDIYNLKNYLTHKKINFNVIFLYYIINLYNREIMILFVNNNNIYYII